MGFWALFWEVLLIIGITLFITMFLFVTYRGFFEIKELLHRDEIADDIDWNERSINRL